MKILAPLSLLAACALLSGCASIVSKSQYPVRFDSTPSGAEITIRDASGETVFSGTTPTTVTLDAHAGYFRGQDYTVQYQLDGFIPATGELRRGVDGWYIFGNIAFGGLIGWLVVDPLTGSMWTLPKEHVMNLQQASAGTGREQELEIVGLDDVPEALREKLVLIQ